MNGGHAARWRTPCGSTVEVDAAFRMHEYACIGSDEEALRRAVRQHHALDLPPPGRAAVAGGVTFIHAAPRRLLLTGDTVPAANPPGLLATDVGDGLVRLRCRGSSVREWLGRFMTLDLRRRTLAAGHATWGEFLVLRALLHCVGEEHFDLYLAASCSEDLLESCIAFGALEPASATAS